MRPTRALLDAAADSAMITVRDVIARRLVTLGVVVEQVKRTDARTILVEIKGPIDLPRVQAVIARPARLRLSLVDLTVLPEQLTSGRAPVGSQILLTPQGERVAVMRRVLIDNERVSDAYRMIDKQSGRPNIELRLDDLGTQRLAYFTSANLGRSLAIILDDVVLATHVIDRQVSDGVVRISGSFKPEDAAALAVSLRSGPLPVDVTIVEQRNQLKR
jgi:preprotein translocase subunit SecD